MAGLIDWLWFSLFTSDTGEPKTARSPSSTKTMVRVIFILDNGKEYSIPIINETNIVKKSIEKYSCIELNELINRFISNNITIILNNKISL